MATVTLGTYGNYTWYLDYTLSQSVTNNQSTVSYTLRIKRNVSASNGAFATRDFTVAIEGTDDTESEAFDFRDYAEHNFVSGSKVFTHDTDGTHDPIHVRGEVSGAYVSSGFPVPQSTATKQISLPTIPRAATSITRSSGTQTGSATTLSISPLVSSFYYVLEYQSPYTTTWTTIGPAGGIAGSSWPYSSFTPGHGEIPNAESGTIQFRVTTKDSSGGTTIGSAVTASFVYTVPDTVVPVAGVPTWTEGATTAGLSTLTATGAVFAQGWSKLIPTFSATPGTGASTASAVATVAGVSGNTTSGVAFANPVTTQGSAATFDVAVTDSRGRADHETGTVSPAVHRWTMPTASSGSVAVTPTSSTQTIALSGLSATTTSFYLSGSQRNVLQTRVGYRDLTTAGAWVYGSWTSQALSSSDSADNAYVPGSPVTVATGLDPAHEYEVTLQVRDIFGSNSVNYSNGLPYVESSILVPAQNVLLAYDGNDAVGIKKVPTQGVLDVGGTIYQDKVGGSPQIVVDMGDAATTSAAGIVELATQSEAVTGTDATRAVTPAAMGYLNTGYRFVQRLIIDSSTTFSKASYPWLRAIDVDVTAGGGGSGGAVNARVLAGGGGGGGSARKFITDIAGLASSETVTVGAGGSAGAGTGGDGGTGGTSSFGTLVVATGGTGGQGGSAAGLLTGGTGGVGTTGDELLQGSDGMPGYSLGSTAGTDFRAFGHGGASQKAGQRVTTVTSGNGLAGYFPGGGAAGAGAGSTAQRSGAVGGAGRITVDLYA